jgi:hypothetical protein
MLLKAVTAFSLATVGGLASMDYAIVDVQEGGPKGTRIVVPVPVLFAEAALSFVPDHARRVELGKDAEQWLPVVRKLAAELKNIPDAELVRVQEHGSDVRIAKVGDHLEVRVHDGGDEVSVNVPFEALDEMLASLHDGRLDVRRVVGALHRAHGQLVDVRNGDDHVSVRVF